MKNAWSALTAFILLAAFASSLAVGIITERQNTAMPPELRVGNWWSYIDTVRWENWEAEHTVIMRNEVIGDSGDTWLATFSFEPNAISGGYPPWTEEARTVEVDKTTLLGVFMETRGTRPCRVDPAGPEIASQYVSRTHYTYEFLDGPLWPLSRGKKVRIIESSTVREQCTDPCYDSEESTRHYTTVVTYEVEKVESVTVPAGTFRSFKIIRYIEGKEAADARWYSPDARNWVRMIEDYSTEEYVGTYTRELQSYSLLM